jgi:hypothetical protein
MTILRKTLKGAVIYAITLFVIIFLKTMMFGARSSNQPFGMGAAPNKWKSISFKETCKEVPSILSVAIFGGFVSFLVFYGYNKNCLEKQRKSEEETDKE